MRHRTILLGLLVIVGITAVHAEQFLYQYKEASSNYIRAVKVEKDDEFVYLMLSTPMKPAIATRQREYPNGERSTWYVQAIVRDGRGTLKIRHLPERHRVHVTLKSGEYFTLKRYPN